MHIVHIPPIYNTVLYSPYITYFQILTQNCLKIIMKKVKSQKYLTPMTGFKASQTSHLYDSRIKFHYVETRCVNNFEFIICLSLATYFKTIYLHH